MPGLSRSLREVVWPAFGAAALCAAWLELHVHTGVGHRLLGLVHVAGSGSQPVLLGLLFVLSAAGIATSRQGIAEGLSRLAARSRLGGVDSLAAASFAAYARNAGVGAYRDPDLGSLVAYRAAGPIVVALGGPVGAEPAEVERRFLGWARRPVVWWGAGQTRGRSGVRLGREAILRPAGFSLGGRAMADVRHAVTRARRSGVRAEWTAWSRLDAAVRGQVREVDRRWRGRRRLRLRFSVSSLADARAGARTWVLAWRGDRLEAFITWLPSADGRGAVLDLLRRRPDAVPGSVELLIAQSLEAFRERGVGWVSLGLAPRRGLHRFKAKFRPEWHDRYLVSPGLPRPLALAAAAWVHLVPPIGR